MKSVHLPHKIWNQTKTKNYQKFVWKWNQQKNRKMQINRTKSKLTDGSDMLCIRNWLCAYSFWVSFWNRYISRRRAWLCVSVDESTVCDYSTKLSWIWVNHGYECHKKNIKEEFIVWWKPFCVPFTFVFFFLD